MDEHYQIPALVLRLGEHTATLQLADQTVAWPRDRLPEDVREGDTVHVRIASKQTELTERHERARAMLTEILGGRA